MAKAKLDGMFGLDDDDDEENLLTYAPPKVPQKPKHESSANSESIVLKACAVSCFRLVEGQYKPYRKLGIAVLHTPKKRDCRIILYATRDKHIAYAQLHVNFAFTITSNVYASFYDSSNQGWSVMFDNDKILSDFAAHVCLGKFFCSDQSGIMTQDVSSGEGSHLQVGDSVEVRYTGRLIENHTIGREFDSNIKSDKLFRFKLGAKKVISGWEDGLINMMKGGHRILIVPPSKGYGDKGLSGRIPGNAILAFDIQVIRVKHGRGHSDSVASVKSTRTKTPVDSPPLPSIPVTSAADNDLDSEEDVEDMNVKQRTRSIAEKLSISDSGSPVRNQNAKLLARMAKMGGQAVLPGVETSHSNPPAVPSESPVDANSSLETNDPGSYAPKVVHPKPQHASELPQYAPSPQYNAAPGMPSGHPIYGDLPNQQSAFRPAMVPPSYPTAQAGFQPGGYPVMPGQLMPYQSPAAAMAMQQQMNLSMGSMPPTQASHINQVSTSESNKNESKTQDVHTAMLVSETRQQNTEVRISISKLQDKVDKVWERLGDIKVSSGGLSYPSMETGALLQNLTRIIQENERLKQEVVDQSDKIEKQNEKMNEMLQKNRSFMESNNRALELKNDDFKASATQSQQRVLDLEQEKLNLTKQLSETTGEVTRLQCLVNEYKKIERDLKDKLVNVTSTSEAHKDEMVLLKATVDETKKNLQISEALYKEELNAKREFGRRLENSEDEFKSLQRRLAEQEQESSNRLASLEENCSKLNSELDRTRKDYERELDGLREKLRAERAIGFSEKSLELNKIEEEITAQWKTKCERLVRAERERLTRQIKEVEEEKRRAEAEVVQYENRIDTFRSKALEMKQRFKEEVESLKDELEEAKSREREMDRDELIKEVRRLMNQVFHALRQKVTVERRYRGERVLEMLKGTIRKMTLRLMGEEVSSSEEESESESESEASEAPVNEDNSVETVQLRQLIMEQQQQLALLKREQEMHRQEIKEDIKEKDPPIVDSPELVPVMSGEILTKTAGDDAMEFSVANSTENSEELTVKESHERTVDIPSEVEGNVEQSSDMNDHEEANVEQLSDMNDHEEASLQDVSSEEEKDAEKDEQEETEETKTDTDVEHDKVLTSSGISRELEVADESLYPSREHEGEVDVIRPMEDDVNDNQEDQDDHSPSGVDVTHDIHINEDLDGKAAATVLKEDMTEPSVGESASPAPVGEVSEPFSVGLSPPPLSSHDDDSSSDEQQQTRPSILGGDTGTDADTAEVTGTDDGEGVEFSTPPSGGDTEEKGDESTDLHVDSTEFDDILNKPPGTGTLQHPKTIDEELETEDAGKAKDSRVTADDNVPLFGNDSDDDYDDIFGDSSKKPATETNEEDEELAPKPVSLKESMKLKKEETADDKPKPPPLFDDDDDDDFDLFK